MHFLSHLNGAHITIVTSIEAFSVATLSIYLGYKLFLHGAKGEFKFTLSKGDGEIGLESVAPGIAFALFGAFIACYALFKTII